MPTRYRQESNTVDNSFFADSIVSKLTEGKSYFDNPTINDLVDFYGGVINLAKALVGEGVYKSVDSARRQITRMRNNPNLKVKPETLAKFSSVNINNLPKMMISIEGSYSYDGLRWAYGNFDYAPTRQEMQRIVYAARPSNPDRNQDALDAFMDAYDVPVQFQFATGTKVDIDPVTEK
jgi:hypothetical protein